MPIFLLVVAALISIRLVSEVRSHPLPQEPKTPVTTRGCYDAVKEDHWDGLTCNWPKQHRPNYIDGSKKGIPSDPGNWR